MADQRSVKVTILWAHEIRIAAQLVRSAVELCIKAEGEPEFGKQASLACVEAMKACHAALTGIEGDTHLIVCEAPKPEKATTP